MNVNPCEDETITLQYFKNIFSTKQLTILRSAKCEEDGSEPMITPHQQLTTEPTNTESNTTTIIKDEKHLTSKLMMYCIIMPIVFLPLLITVIIILVKKRRQRARDAEVKAFDDNYYYGQDEYDYEMETRVEDLND